MTSKEALARLQQDDVVGRAVPSPLRSSEHASAVSGKTQGGPPPLKPSKAPAAETSMEVSADLLGATDIEDLEITPNLSNTPRRPDTMPDWMLASPTESLAKPEPLRPTPAPRGSSGGSSGRTWGVMLLGLVAAGSWWFAADGVKALNPAPPVVAAAPALAATAPALDVVKPEPEPVAAVPQPTLSKAPVQEPVAQAKPEPAAKAAPAKARRRRAPRLKSRRRAPLKSAPVAPAAKRGAKSSVSPLKLGAAGSGRSCRTLTNINATDHERVNVCFQVKPAASLSSVVVQWRHDGALVRSTEHDLPSSKSSHSIRAFSRVQSGQSGAWTVQVRTPDGQILASKRFSVGM